MAIDRRIVTGIIVATAMAFERPLLALADTGPAPAGVPGPDAFDASAFAPYVGLAILILVAALAIRRPGSRRPIAAILVLGTSVVLALAAFIAGAFSCWDCSERPAEGPYDAVAIVLLVIGLALAFKIGTGGRHRTSDTAAGSTPTD